jgi:hypothetical protein
MLVANNANPNLIDAIGDNRIGEAVTLIRNAQKVR